jgi:hypothetical protein
VSDTAELMLFYVIIFLSGIVLPIAVLINRFSRRHQPTPRTSDRRFEQENRRSEIQLTTGADASRARRVGSASNSIPHGSDIFISYASVDRATAEGLASVISRKGWSVWWDRQILAGKTFDAEIERALDAAKCVIVLWSRASVASDWVKGEAAEAAKRQVLVPIVIEKDVRIPLEFRRLQAVVLLPSDASVEPLNMLIASITSLVPPTTTA